MESGVSNLPGVVKGKVIYPESRDEVWLACFSLPQSIQKSILTTEDKVNPNPYQTAVELHESKRKTALKQISLSQRDNITSKSLPKLGLSSDTTRTTQTRTKPLKLWNSEEMKTLFHNLKISKLSYLTKQNISRLSGYIKQRLEEAKVDSAAIDTVAGPNSWIDKDQLNSLLVQGGCELSSRDLDLAMYYLQPSHPERVSARSFKAALSQKSLSGSESARSHLSSAYSNPNYGQQSRLGNVSAHSVSTLHSASSFGMQRPVSLSTNKNAEIKASETSSVSRDTRGILPLIRSGSRSKVPSEQTVHSKIHALRARLNEMRGNQFSIFRAPIENPGVPVLSKSNFVNKVVGLGLADETTAHEMFRVLKPPFADYLDHRAFYKDIEPPD